MVDLAVKEKGGIQLIWAGGRSGGYVPVIFFRDFLEQSQTFSMQLTAMDNELLLEAHFLLVSIAWIYPFGIVM